MPGEQNVLLAILARVADERKGQRVFVRPAKLVHPGAFAVFRSFAAGSLNRNGIAAHRVGAPDVACAVMISIDIERAVSLDRPDGCEGVRPRPGQRGWTRARRSRARAY